MIVYSAIRPDTEMPCSLHRVNIGTKEQKLPAVASLLPLNHLLDALGVIVAACILHAICCDDEQGMLRDILGSCILVDVPDMMDRSTDGIQKGGATSYGIISVGHRLDALDINAIMNNLAGVVEENSRDESFALSFFLLLDHGVEASDSVCLKPTHRAAAVKNEYDLS